jgi:hypothetical protein
MRAPDRFRDPTALVEACVFGVAGTAVALMWPWPSLAAVAGPLIFVLVLVIATWPRRPPPSPPPPPPPPPPPAESVTAAQAAAELVGEWERNLPDGSPARADAGKVIDLADDLVHLILRCRREIGRLGEGVASRVAADKLTTLTSHFTAYVNTSRPPREQADWKELEDYFEWITVELRELLEQLRGS